MQSLKPGPAPAVESYMTEDFFTYYSNLKTSVEAKAKAKEGEREQRIASIRASLVQLFSYCLEVCCELEPFYNRLSVTKDGDKVQMIVGVARFEYSLSDTVFGPKLLREVPSADTPLIRWFQSRDVTFAEKVDGADFAQRHVEDMSREAFRAHLLACLTVYAEYYYQSQL